MAFYIPGAVLCVSSEWHAAPSVYNVRAVRARLVGDGQAAEGPPVPAGRQEGQQQEVGLQVHHRPQELPCNPPPRSSEEVEPMQKREHADAAWKRLSNSNVSHPPYNTTGCSIEPILVQLSTTT